jgi:dTDP-4-dehydrorhamnose reductase
MKILVTGANGLLGQKLILQLHTRKGVDLIATGRGDNRNPPGLYTYMPLDVTDEQNVRSVLLKTKPEIVIHTAAMTQVDVCEMDRSNCWLQNVTAVEYLLESCQTIDAFLVHLSTDFVFDGLNGPYREEDPTNPLSYYAKSKVASEDLVLQSAARAGIVRTMLVYGVAHDMSRSNIILWVKRSLEQGKKIKVVNDQWRMPTLAEDLAKGCILLAEKQAQGIFHISGKDMMTPYDMALATAVFFDLDPSLIEAVDESVFTQPGKRPAKTGFVLDKSIRVLGYNPMSFNEGIQTLAQQLRNDL